MARSLHVSGQSGCQGHYKLASGKFRWQELSLCVSLAKSGGKISACLWQFNLARSLHVTGQFGWQGHYRLASGKFSSSACHWQVQVAMSLHVSGKFKWQWLCMSVPCVYPLSVGCYCLLLFVVWCQVTRFLRVIGKHVRLSRG